MRGINIQIPLLGILILCLLGCSQDPFRGSNDDPDPDKIEVTFSLSLPTDLQFDRTDSKAVSELPLSVIIFEKRNGDEYFAGFGAPVLIDGNSQYSVRLENTDNYVHLMVLANAGDLSQKGWTDNTTKEEISASLVYENSAGFHSEESTIPMWGETAPFIPSPNLNTLQEVTLIRMFSAIQVVFSDQIDPADFEMKEVRLYNAHTRGLLIPDAANWDAASKTVTDVSLPAQTLVGSHIVLEENMAQNFMDAVYVCESWPGVNPDRMDVPFLLIGGYYEEDNYLTWYRVDFFSEDSQGIQSYRPLLRNRLNRIRVNAIGNRGEPDPDQAAKMEKVEMDVEIFDWSIVEGNLMLRGYNVFSVSRNDILLSSETNEMVQVTVYTDYEDGWAASVTQGGEWLRLTGPERLVDGIAYGAPNVYTSLSFRVDENMTGLTREGEIHIIVGGQVENGAITGGRIDYTLYVEQTADHIVLQLLDAAGRDVTELLFGSNASNLTVAAQKITVKWNLPGEICLVAVSEGEVPFRFHTDSDQPEGEAWALKGGEVELTLRPEFFTTADVTANPFIERSSTLDFIVSSNSSYEKISLDLRHINYHFELEKPDRKYRLGQEYVIDVITNTDDWEITSVVDFQDVLLPVYPQEGQNQKKVHIDREAKTITVTFTSDAARYEWETGFFARSVKANMSDFLNVPAFTVLPNSYLVKPGQQVDIPVSNLQYIWREYFGRQLFIYNTPTRLDLSVVWQSEPGLVTIPASVSALRTSSVGLTEDYRQKTFPVQTASGLSGNAVVAASLNGEVIWSWHIWVDDYDPDTDYVEYTHSGTTTTRFMDRNLGATGKAANNTRSIGNYYQWGRKDPFPGPNSYGQGNATTRIRTVYEGGGAERTDIKNTVSVGSVPRDNLRQSILAPDVFITCGADDYIGDWYSQTDSEKNDLLWIDESGYKTIFDPCPQGWRVPYMTNGRTPWFNIGTVNPSDNAYTWNEVGQFVTTGFMRMQDGKFNSLSFLHTYMADVTGSLAYGFRAAEGVNGTNMYKRANGQVVRCVKDNY